MASIKAYLRKCAGQRKKRLGIERKGNKSMKRNVIQSAKKVGRKMYIIQRQKEPKGNGDGVGTESLKVSERQEKSEVDLIGMRKIRMASNRGSQAHTSTYSIPSILWITS